MPTSSSAPSSSPSLSNQPSISLAPSTSPTMGGPTTRIVPSRLAFGFFANTTAREPTQAELDGLIAKTDEFYSQFLRTQYGSSFISFQAENVTSEFTSQAAELPVRVDFDAKVVFSTPAGNTPTSHKIFKVMENANYPDYIKMFVWASEPMGQSIFFDTERVSFGARGESFP